MHYAYFFSTLAASATLVDAAVAMPRTNDRRGLLDWIFNPKTTSTSSAAPAVNTAAYVKQAQDANPGRNYGWTAIGCYQDAPSPNRVLSETYVAWSNMTLPVCMNYCLGRGYTYGGVQYGSECWCGNAINQGYYDGPSPDKWLTGPVNSGQVVDYSECKAMSCAGDSSTDCGGHWRLNVFVVSYLGVSSLC